MQEKKLRDVLVEIFMRIHACDSEDDCCGLLDWIQEAAKEALAATTEETEMDFIKLATWDDKDAGKHSLVSLLGDYGVPPTAAELVLCEMGKRVITQFVEEDNLGKFHERIAEFRDKRRAEIRAAHWMSEWDKGYMAAMETVFDLLGKYGLGEEEGDADS